MITRINTLQEGVLRYTKFYESKKGWVQNIRRKITLSVSVMNSPLPVSFVINLIWNGEKILILSLLRICEPESANAFDGQRPLRWSTCNLRGDRKQKLAQLFSISLRLSYSLFWTVWVQLSSVFYLFFAELHSNPRQRRNYLSEHHKRRKSNAGLSWWHRRGWRRIHM